MFISHVHWYVMIDYDQYNVKEIFSNRFQLFTDQKRIQLVGLV